MVRGALEALPFVSLLFLDVVEHLGICLAQTAGRSAAFLVPSRAASRIFRL